ncbi:MAG: response regulator transcription factor [Butyrivibrio sp.]|nr:response regulator transcription factor [Butyrivibrio sp.]
MPEMNGFDLMRKIRASFPDITIPIIFLTGKNDKELVFQVLEDKPDGYLLKTSQKEVILDTIHRFFAETIFRASQKGIVEEPEPED